ncbi:hypothetical protein VTN49DRAFT_6507 [Thermomyces lanuginosus]|uniref:uncharacterized protein n=1 Tax=Thermomyces lanuginosus TaxID=5541 RepID=UPI0037421FC2
MRVVILDGYWVGVPLIYEQATLCINLRTSIELNHHLFFVSSIAHHPSLKMQHDRCGIFQISLVDFHEESAEDVEDP